MQLVRFGHGHTPFERLEDEWRAQAKGAGEDFDEYSVPYVEHARSISSENPPTHNYGIFGLDIGAGDIEAVLHANTARLPETTGVTLRLLWVLLAPKYDYDDVEPDLLARISSGLVLGALDLAKDGLQVSQHIKIHINNIADRRFFAGAAFTLQNQRVFSDVAIRGNWLHMSL